MLCPKCGSEIKNNEKICEECDYVINKYNNDDSIINILMNFEVESYLKWGGIVIILMGLFFVVPTYLMSTNSMNTSKFMPFYNTLNSLITVLMRGIYYYGIGVIIILLKKLISKIDKLS